MPPRKNKNNLEKTLDINLEASNIVPTENKQEFFSENSLVISASSEKSALPEKSVLKENSNEYITDPITGEKYLKPKGFSDVISYQSFNIPQLKREGFKIISPTNENPHEIQLLLNQGWEFVDPNTPGCEEAAKMVYGGLRRDGSPAFHRFMQMEDSKWMELENRRQEELTQREQDTIFNPTGGDRNMYVGKEFRAPYVTRNNKPIESNLAAGMDIGLTNSFKNAMR